jgi:ABC-2 type transport system ATP-binding protein
MTALVVTRDVTKRFRNREALSKCTLNIPMGKVVGLVGPNGAGKSTLLNLAVGLTSPNEGSIEVFGKAPSDAPPQLSRIGFVAQDHPICANLTVNEHLTLGAHLNPSWDGQLAKRRIKQLGLDPGQRAGKLSGGQRAQLSLTLALAKHPDALILDEPVASLDPLARREFLETIMEAVADSGMSVILSSHLVSDVERVCDFLVLLVASRVALVGEVDDIVSSHHRLVGPAMDDTSVLGNQYVVASNRAGRQVELIVRSDGPILDPAWIIESLSLEDIVLAYMGQGHSTDHSDEGPDEQS